MLCGFANAASAQIVTDTIVGTLNGASMVFSPVNVTTTGKTFTLLTEPELATLNIFPGTTIYGLAFEKENNGTLSATAQATLDIYVRSGDTATTYSNLPNYSWPYIFNTFLNAGFTLAAQFTAGANLILPPVPGWIPFMFDAPFVYMGGSLEIHTAWQATPNSTTGGPMFYHHTTPDHKSMACDCSNNNNLITGSLRNNMVFYHSPPPVACSGSPTGGQAVGSPDVCINDSTKIYLFNASAGPGITYQWQSKPVASTSWTNITGANSVFLRVAPSGHTDYRCLVTCTNSATTSPSALFSINPTMVVIDSISHTTNLSSISFTANAQQALTYQWDFGDGSTGTGLNTQHYYSTDSTYTVRLIAFGDCGSDTMYKTVTVGCPGYGSFQNLITAVGDTVLCPGTQKTIQLVNPAPTGFNIRWQQATLGGLFTNITGTGSSIVVAPTTAMRYRSLVQCPTSINDRISNQVIITPGDGPTAGTITAMPSGAGNHITFSTSGTLFADSYHWHFGDGNTSTDIAPTHHYPNAGTYQVMLVVTRNPSGCTDTAYYSISILTDVSDTRPSNQSVVLYPNPATDVLIVKAPAEAILSITDLAGKSVYRAQVKQMGESTELDVSNLPTGLYLLKVITEKEVLWKQFQKL